jgi:hypothetical protein
MRKIRRIVGYDGESFGVYYYFVSWDCISLGISICFGMCGDFRSRNIEIHLPFGFIRIGWKLYRSLRLAVLKWPLEKALSEPVRGVHA